MNANPSAYMVVSLLLPIFIYWSSVYMKPFGVVVPVKNISVMINPSCAVYTSSAKFVAVEVDWMAILSRLAFTFALICLPFS